MEMEAEIDKKLTTMYIISCFFRGQSLSLAQFPGGKKKEKKN